MTTLAATLSMLPLIIGLGKGGAMLRPLAVVIVSGLLAQLPLVLIVLPAVLVITGASARRGGGRLAPAAVMADGMPPSPSPVHGGTPR